jgi:signal transduction histidine kinase
VAQEIQDSIGQCLASTKFKIDSILQRLIEEGVEAAPQLLEAIIPILQENIQEARRIQVGLRPSILDDQGILPTITWFCREFKTAYPAIQIETRIEIKEGEVHPLLKTTIYRLMQEALNNAAKHSKADLVDLTLRKTGDRIEFIIQDNGQGFDVEKVLSVKSTEKGFGLTGMREWVEISNGSFAIESAKGKGTTIRTSWKAADTVLSVRSS